MSFKVMTVNGEANSSCTKEFICDSIDDIDKLPKYCIRGTFEYATDPSVNDPCAIGSTALICEPPAVYILAPSNEWKPL